MIAKKIAFAVALGSVVSVWGFAYDVPLVFQLAVSSIGGYLISKIGKEKEV